jgi:DNA-binding transcriptional regulator WhiA
MSFSSETKAELCDSRLDKRSLALAECYGVLLYCNTFRTSEIRIITASAPFAERLPRLFKKAFAFGFDGGLQDRWRRRNQAEEPEGDRPCE